MKHPCVYNYRTVSFEFSYRYNIYIYACKIIYCIAHIIYIYACDTYMMCSHVLNITYYT